MRIELAYLSTFSGRYAGKISGYFFRADIIGPVPKVTFLPAGETFEFEKDKLPYKGHGKPESLLDVAMNFGLHLEHACGGSCACTTCHVVVREGYESLGEPDESEEDLLDRA